MVIRLLIINTYLLFLICSNLYADSSKDYAKKAYHLMEEAPFNNDSFKKSIKLIDLAYKSNPNEPWVYISSSLAVMQIGYDIGSWYRYESFKSDTIEQAYEYAKRANELGLENSYTYAHLARIFIIKKEYKKAWTLLNKSYEINNNNFYTWYYKGLIDFYIKRYNNSLSNLNQGEKLITHRYL